MLGEDVIVGKFVEVVKRVLAERGLEVKVDAVYRYTDMKDVEIKVGKTELTLKNKADGKNTNTQHGVKQRRFHN